MRQTRAIREIILLIGIYGTLVIPVRGQFTHTLLPIGNFGDVQSVEPFAHDLTDLLDSLGGNQTLLFTGDLTDARHSLKHALQRLDTLLSILTVHEDRKIIFISGDRDWANSGQFGWEEVMLLEDYILALKRPDVLWPLRHGCPGPEKVELDLALSLVVLNTQWWNHPFEKPTPESAVCDIATHEEAIEELEKIIEDARFGNLVLAGHYPIFSGGPYGGHYPIAKWLFPVPVVSTMVTAHHQNIGSPREICNERFTKYREDLEDIMSEYLSLIYVSGHEQNIEVRNFEDNILVQSGAADKGGYTARSAATIYSSKSPGLVALHYDMEGNAWATTYIYSGSAYRFESRLRLLQAPCQTPLQGVTVNQRLVPCLDDQYVLTRMESPMPANVTMAANREYAAGPLKRALLGEHYRRTWVTPVEVPFLNLDTYSGGLIPYLEGGGRQTKTLRFTSEDGHEYVFRSVDKDPSKTLSYGLRESLISLVVRDQTTTQHPYGALVTSQLLDKTGILHPQPELFLMPDDAKLGPFRAKFGHMLGMLEERPSGRKEVMKTFADADKILGSTEMFREIYKDRDHAVDMHEFAKARVFDLLVGDWSKHEDNWKWAGYVNGIETRYRPIPVDRDHVFSRWDGLLPWLVDREWAKPQGEDFGFQIQGLRSLMWQSRHLDRFLGSELTLDDWTKAARDIQSSFTPQDIDSAFKALPEEAQDENSTEIAAKLMARLQDVETYTEQHYRMLAREVDICGSNKTELFEVSRNDDGSVDVAVFKIKQGEKDKQFFRRRFYADETKEIRLFGLQGDDKIHVTGNARRSILLRIIPGSGINEIIDSAHVQKGQPSTRIYSLHQTDKINGGAELKEVHIPYPEAYRYRRTAFTYNTYMPLLYVWSSSGNGLVIGGGVTFTRQAYDKPDYSAMHGISASVSTLGNLRFGYDGRLRHVLGRWDMTYGLMLDKHRRLNYFFGTGNGTVLDPDLLLADFYTLQFSSLRASVGLSRAFWDRSSIEFGIKGVGSGRENLEGNIFEEGVFPDIAGLERLRIAKGYISCDIDFRDRTQLPERGMRLTLLGTAAAALNDATNYANASASLEYFATAKPFTIGLKVGGATHEGVTPFYDLHYLGQNTDLRGFRQNRFTGRSLAYVNTDLRIQLVDNPRALIPYKLGVILFLDSGRVFDAGDTSGDKSWHTGYGAGIYFVPLKERFALQISMGFSDEESGLLRFGFGQAF